MKVELEPGKYIVAVSGGVDSVVLLHLLANSQFSVPSLQLVVAHFDHGIRPDSSEDCKHVASLAAKYGLKFESVREELGQNASEALARERRYDFLYKVKDKYGAKAIVTAHHQDDLMETAAINLLRGTGRKGLTSLSSGDVLVRPLLVYSKAEILDYAQQHGLQWHEDSTNADMRYLRNALRAKLSDIPAAKRQEFLDIITKMQTINQEIDGLLAEIFGAIYNDEAHIINRGRFIALPYIVSLELIAYWLRAEKVQFDSRQLDLLVVALKTGLQNTSLDVSKDLVFCLTAKDIRLERRSSV